MFDRLSRREFSLTLASVLGSTPIARRPWSMLHRGTPKDVTKTSEAIHQDITFNASAARVYAALTDAGEFTKLTTFSSMKEAAPAQIAPDEGGTFSIGAASRSGVAGRRLAGRRVFDREVRARGSRREDVSRLRPHRLSQRPRRTSRPGLADKLLGATQKVSW